MSKAGSSILQGAREAIAFARGELDPSTYVIHVPSDIDVKALRKSLNLSQREFAERFGFTKDRIQDWEQGRSKPDGALRAYLMIIREEPKVVERVLQAA